MTSPIPPNSIFRVPEFKNPMSSMGSIQEAGLIQPAAILKWEVQVPSVFRHGFSAFRRFKVVKGCREALAFQTSSILLARPGSIDTALAQKEKVF